MRLIGDPSSNAEKVANLRTAFDQSYAAPPPSQATAAENLLSVCLAGNFYAIRVCEITSLIKLRRVVALPSPVSELLGVVGLRGVCLPVYSLSALLGYGKEPGQERWAVLCGVEESLAFGFCSLEGSFQVPASSAEHVFPADGIRHLVLSIPSLIAAVQQRCTLQSLSKGQ